MRKFLIIGFAIGALYSCNDKTKINECRAIADKELEGVEGFELFNADYLSRDGLKLAVPESFESSTHVATISFKNREEDYRGTTCYYSSTGELLGSKSY